MGYIGAGLTRFNTADQLTVSGDAEFQGNANLGDNDKIQLGAGNDLQIFHDGLNSVITDAGTGVLSVQSNGTRIAFYDSANSQEMANMYTAGAVNFYHNGAKKLETTSTGVDVTGTATADGVQLGDTSTSGDVSLKIKGDASSRGFIMFGDAGGEQLGDIMYDHSDNHMRFRANNAERMRITSGGNVLVGKTADDNGTAGIRLTSGGLASFSVSGGSTAIFNRKTSDGHIVNFRKSEGDVGHIGASGGDLYINGSSDLAFRVGDDEKARIDSTGDLLIGKTGRAANTAGIELLGAGPGIFSYGGEVMKINRLSDNGSIVQFAKDNTKVGFIKSISGVANAYVFDPRNPTYEGAGLAGGSFDTTTAVITPTDGSGVTSDGALDLGNSTARFRNLRLSGGVYLGGQGSANYLDDYEEGTWTPTDATGQGTTWTLNRAAYTKIGNTVYLQLYISAIVATTSSAVLIGGLPFACVSHGWSPSLLNTSDSANVLYARVKGGTSTIDVRTPAGDTTQAWQIFNGDFMVFQMTYNTTA